MIKKQISFLNVGILTIIGLQVAILMSKEEPVAVAATKTTTVQPIQQKACDTNFHVAVAEPYPVSNSNVDEIQFNKLAVLLTETIKNELSTSSDHQTTYTVVKNEPSQQVIQDSNENYQIIESQLFDISENSTPEEMLNMKQQIAALTKQDQERYVEKIGSLYASGQISFDTINNLIP
jgi:hypothetical protein